MALLVCPFLVEACKGETFAWGCCPHPPLPIKLCLTMYYMPSPVLLNREMIFG
jgi:hypothetical protein